jgi:hypothetical protein
VRLDGRAPLADQADDSFDDEERASMFVASNKPFA